MPTDANAMPKRLLVLVYLMLLAACVDQPTPPLNASELVILLGSEEGDLLVVDPSSPPATALKRRISIPRFLDRFAPSPDGSTIYFTAFERLPERKVLAFDMKGLVMAREQGIADLIGTGNPQDIVDSGGEALTPTPDGSNLFVANWRDGGRLGIGILDSKTFAFNGFVEHLTVRRHGLTTVPPGPRWPRGAVLALAQRPSSSTTEERYLFAIDPRSFQVIDSLVAPVADSAAYQLVSAPDGRHIYLSGAHSVIKYDLIAESALQEVQFPTSGWVTISPDGQEIYRTDQRLNFDATASQGRVFVLNQDLQWREPIDLSRHQEDGHPPVTSSVGTSRDGQRLYVVVGTASFAFSPPYQVGRLFVIRRADHSIERIIPLHSWNVGPPFATP